ncbi:MAG: TonB-dependent receptor [Deltaproteobacteria bacterium]
MLGFGAFLAAGSTAHAQGGPAPFAPSHDRGANAGQDASGPPAAASATTAENAPPRLLRFVSAEYPAAARDAGIQGSVVLQLTIDDTGRVNEATVSEGLGHGLDEAAIAAARQFEFSPARQGGQPVRARIRYRYRFTLETVVASGAPQGPLAVLRGTVRNARNQLLAGATVTIRRADGAESQVITDASGAFRFELTGVGVLSVDVAAEGYRPYRSEEQLFPHDDVQVLYRLVAVPPAAASSPPPGASTEETLTVRGTRPPREVTRTTLERRELMRIPGTGGDALRAIQNLPGLARPPFTSGALIVRGASPADTAIFADGTVIPQLYHFGGLSSVIQTEMLDRIDFYPGNFSARYGRAMAGIVDVGLRSPRRRGYHAVANFNFVDVSAFAEGAITPNLSVAIAARRSVVDAVLGLVLPRIPGVGFTALPVYYDYQAVLEYRPAPNHRLRLAVFGDDDTLSIILRNPSDNAPTLAGGFSFATRFHIAQLSWVADLAPGTRSTLMASVGWTNTDLSASEAFKFQLSSFPINVRYELSHTFSRFLRGHFGFDIAAGPGTVSFSGLRFDPGSPVGDISNAQRIASDINTFAYRPSAYIETEITPVPGLRVVPGLRIDWFREINAAIAQPRASFRWEVLRNFAVRGGVGLYAQPPSFAQSTNAPNTFFPGQTIGNQNLRPSRAMHYALGLEHTFDWIRAAPFLRNVTLSVEGFYKSLTDLVVGTPSVQLRQQPPPPPYSNDGTGQVFGMEMLLRYRADEHFFGWVAYTLMRSTRVDHPGEAEHLYSYDQTHILTAVASYRIGRGWEVGLRFRYVTGNLYTPNTGALYNADSFQYVPTPGVANSMRVADFHQLDLRIDKGWRFRNGGSFGIFLEVLNVYNNSNQEGLQYNYNYTQSQPINGLPIYPNFGIRGEL